MIIMAIRRNRKLCKDGDIFRVMRKYEFYSDKLNINEEIVKIKVSAIIYSIQIGVNPVHLQEGEKLPFEVSEEVYTPRTNGADIKNPYDKALFNILQTLHRKGQERTITLAVSKNLATKLREAGIVE